MNKMLRFNKKGDLFSMEKLLEKFNLNSKKGIENLVIFLVLVIIVIVVINATFTESEDEIISTATITTRDAQNDSLEEKLENILASIRGVGKVDVMISYTNSLEKVPLYDTKETTTITEETDSNGGERKTKEVSNEYTVVYEEGNSDKTAIIKQNIMPEIIGVIVTAEGAENNSIKENIINAVVAVTNIPNHKIQVFAQ